VIQTPVPQDLYVFSPRSVSPEMRVPTQSRSELFSSVYHNSFYSQSRKPPPPASHSLHQAIIRALISSSFQGKQDHYSLRLLLFMLQCPLLLTLQCLVYFSSRYSVCPKLLTLHCAFLPLLTLQCLSTAAHATVSGHCCSRIPNYTRLQVRPTTVWTGTFSFPQLNKQARNWLDCRVFGLDAVYSGSRIPTIHYILLACLSPMQMTLPTEAAEAPVTSVYRCQSARYL
jgi:hypothetical protein